MSLSAEANDNSDIETMAEKNAIDDGQMQEMKANADRRAVRPSSAFEGKSNKHPYASLRQSL